jgi:hypothetical protein
MSDHDEQIAERLAALEAKQDAKAVEAAAVQLHLHTPPRHPGGGAGFNKEAQYRQDAAIHVRRRLREEWAQAYEEQLARAKPKTDQLEAKRRGLEAKRDELQRRHAVELAKVQADIDSAHREIDRLTNPPPIPADPPSPDAVEVVAVYDSGHLQLIPREVMDAQKRRRQQERKR